MAKKIAETPLMKQYFEMKQKHPDAVLLFRVGDFYETYSTDAVIASEILGITLTKRANGVADSIELAGFPHHALDTYLPKLIRAGKRVAICEQLEDPKLTKKLVKRGITELVTPGVSINDNVLSHRENNFLAALHFGKKHVGVAFLDISTGEFLVAEGNEDYIDKLLSNFAPKEVLINREAKKTYQSLISGGYLTFDLDDWIFTTDAAHDRLKKQFETHNLKGFGIEDMESAIIAAGAILHYLDITQHTNIQHISAIARVDEGKYVRLDKFTVRNLEIINPLGEGGKSLLSVIDHTTTPMGARLLRRWILFPLVDINAINSRLNVVEYFMRDPESRTGILEHLAAIGDLERLISKVAVGRISPREVVQLKNSLSHIAPIKELCEATDSPELKNLAAKLSGCMNVVAKIDNELLPEAPILANRGGFVCQGVNDELDDLRHIACSGKDYLLEIQRREVAATGISSLKIGYNNVFGYYIEVRNTYKDKVPQEWIRKQTLTGAERYITQELKEYEEKILGAEEKIFALELQIFNQLVSYITRFVNEIQLNASTIAHIDVLLSHTVAAIENRYNRPVVNDSLDIHIVEGRHPVIEKELPAGEQYISNSVSIGSDTQQIIMITGPNMAGKSALLRQTAIIVLLAQIGSFVPAQGAEIGVVDKIFTRVGASDNISLGESTFMVEMNEAASILNNLSERSLVLFDELGRGTSTYDGISIAWSIVEYIHNHPQFHAKTLFATHYHELNEMEAQFPRIANYNVSVKELKGKVVFLRKLVKGGSAHSFGIHVAKLAGMPRTIVNRAQAVLKRLEENNRANADNQIDTLRSISTASQPTSGMQMSIFQLDDPVLSQVRDEILDIDINNLTPMEALNKLNDIKHIIQGK